MARNYSLVTIRTSSSLMKTSINKTCMWRVVMNWFCGVNAFCLSRVAQLRFAVAFDGTTRTATTGARRRWFCTVRGRCRVAVRRITDSARRCRHVVMSVCHRALVRRLRNDNQSLRYSNIGSSSYSIVSSIILRIIKCYSVCASHSKYIYQ